jgi:tetratricopeptide (TPR) repeat protein
LLRAIAELDEGALHAGLAGLQAAEFLYETSLFPDLEYTFKHALTHEVAYAGLLGDRRRQLHAAIVEAIERLHADRLAEQVELLAHHATRGEAGEKAARYLRQAGARAVARSANREAIGFFEQALAILGELPETSEILAESLDTRIALGPALIAVKGSLAPEVEASYLRAQKLLDRFDDPARRFPVLWGLWYISYTSGHYPKARDTAEQLLQAAESGDDGGRLVEAHHALWATLTAMGAPMEAVIHAERGIALYERERHAAQAFLYGGHDPGACCRYQLSLDRWLLGQPDRALATLRDALSLAAELQHPLTETNTLWFASWLHYQRGDREAALETSGRLISLAHEHGFSSWADASGVLVAAARGVRLDREAIAELFRDVVASRAAAWRQLLCLCALADHCLEAGLSQEGLSILASIPEKDRRTIFAPELERLEGELLLSSTTSSTDLVGAKFHHALALARERGEKSLELRAAMSLARLLEAGGRAVDARAVLTSVYGWFTEGFDTADLVAAKALLTRLG